MNNSLSQKIKINTLQKEREFAGKVVELIGEYVFFCEQTEKKPTLSAFLSFIKKKFTRTFSIPGNNA